MMIQSLKSLKMFITTTVFKMNALLLSSEKNFSIHFNQKDKL